MPAIHWVHRELPCEVGARGWALSGSQFPSVTGLEAGHEVKVVAIHQGGEVTICDGVGNHWRVPARMVDFGREWRIACDWLPESHPQVMAHLERLLVKLEAAQGEENPAMERDRETRREKLRTAITRARGVRPAEDEIVP